MTTFHGAGAIVPDEDHRVLMVLIERRDMRRWELPSALNKHNERLLETVYRCVEEETSFSLRVRPTRPVCVYLHASAELARTFFGMFFECAVANSKHAAHQVDALTANIMPESCRQKVLEWRFLNWREVPGHDIHPLHALVLEQWSNRSEDELFFVTGDADREPAYYAGDLSALGQYVLNPLSPRSVAPVRSGPSLSDDRRIHIFVSYAHTDTQVRERIWESLLQHGDSRDFKVHHDRNLDAGWPWATSIRAMIDRSDIVLLLVSQAFLDSPACMAEKALALDGSARVVPVVLCGTAWAASADLHRLNAIPRHARPIDSFESEDDAFEEIAMGVLRVVRTLRVKGRAARSDPRGGD